MTARSKRIADVAAEVAFGLFFTYGALSHLAGLAVSDERYTHTILIPLLTLGLLYIGRATYFVHSSPSPRIGAPIMLLGAVLGFAKLGWNQSLQIETLSAVVIWLGVFLGLCGMRAAVSARFPLFLLLLMIPPPPQVMDQASLFLQKASAELTYVLIKLCGVPVYRQGFLFSLPGLNIEVAEQCSGIRSTIGLVISSILAGYVVLHSSWRVLAIALIALPVVIFKNAVRIVAIALLGIYVNPQFLQGQLHHYGGMVFSVLAMAMLIPILMLLRKSEIPAKSQNTAY